MATKLAALIGAAVIALTAVAPSVAAADPRHRGGDRGYYDNHRGGDYGGRGYRHRDNDNDNDALAAGVVGLVLGAVIGSALTESRRAPPPAYYPPPPQPRYSGGYYDGPPPGYAGQDQGYYDQGPQLCVQQQQTWDPYARRYVTLERRVPC
ncbi:MAG: hypothetical protein SGJ23_04020 [Alphaproteobacteria bacterium]|nr:hypothetical protein [Alphaproteobacteria bacterium]